MFVFIGFLFIVGMSNLTLFILTKYAFKSYDHIQSYWIPVVIISVSSTFIAGLFLGLFDEAVACTLQCLAIDRELHNGDTKFGPPTYHKKLRDIFGDGYGKP